MQLLLKASIAGMNDAYFVVIIFGLIGLLMSFFIKKTSQVEDIQYNSKYEATVYEEYQKGDIDEESVI